MKYNHVLKILFVILILGIILKFSKIKRIENFKSLNKIVIICCNDSYVPKSIISLNKFTSLNPDFKKFIIGTTFSNKNKSLAVKYGIKLLEIDLSNDFQKKSEYPIECFYHFYAYKLFPTADFIINLEADIVTNKKIDFNLNKVKYVGGSYSKSHTIKNFKPIINDYKIIKKYYGDGKINNYRILGGIKIYNVKNLIKIKFYEKIVEYYKKSIEIGVPRRGDDSLFAMYQLFNPEHITLLKPNFHIIFKNNYDVKDITFFHFGGPNKKYWDLESKKKLNKQQKYFTENMIEYIFNNFSDEFINLYVPKIKNMGNYL